MFVVEIKQVSSKRVAYLAEGDRLTYATKEAIQLEKDEAELAKIRASKIYDLSFDSLFVKTADSIRKSTNNKYGAKVAYYCESTASIFDTEPMGASIRFDSTFEARVYQVLRRHFPKTSICRQYPLMIKPRTKTYKEIDWKVDFYVNHEKVKCWVEAKGIALPEFKRNLQYLQYFNHDAWFQTYIVCQDSTKIDDKKRALSFKEFCYKLANKEL